MDPHPSHNPGPSADDARLQADFVRRPDLAPVPPPQAVSTYAQRPACWAHVSQENWSKWRWQMRHRVRSAAALAPILDLSPEDEAAITWAASRFPLLTTPHYLALAQATAPCAIRAQILPSWSEVTHGHDGLWDPLGEGAHGLQPGLTQRYPDRVLLVLRHSCASHCRHCTRRRKVGDPSQAPTRAEIEAALNTIAATPTIRDVLVSGGDPLSLSTRRLGAVLSRLRAIPHLDVIRLCTRMPVTLPQRIDAALCECLRALGPIYVNTHFNHPQEASVESGAALQRLRLSGCILNNQMVLLRGVNDDAAIIESMNRWLLRHGCRPYYLFQVDRGQHTGHFRCPLAVGQGILRRLRGRMGGLGVPRFVVDLPGGWGKACAELAEAAPGARGVPLLWSWRGLWVPYEDL